MRILLVEDEHRLARSTARFLHQYNFSVDIVETLAVAWESIRSIDYSLVLLDRRLPDGDGLQLIVMSQKLERVPRFLVLSALGDVNDRVHGLNIGAGDYLVKPYAPEELLARIRAMLRLPRENHHGVVAIGRLRYDRATRNFSVEKRSLELRRRELLILELLSTNAGRIVERDRILDRMYGFEEIPSSNSLESHVSRLRSRLRKEKAGVEIHTARGLGYLLKAAGNQS